MCISPIGSRSTAGRHRNQSTREQKHFQLSKLRILEKKKEKEKKKANGQKDD
jgi:hypothetical protein